MGIENRRALPASACHPVPDLRTHHGRAGRPGSHRRAPRGNPQSPRSFFAPALPAFTRYRAGTLISTSARCDLTMHPRHQGVVPPPSAARPDLRSRATSSASLTLHTATNQVPPRAAGVHVELDPLDTHTTHADVEKGFRRLRSDRCARVPVPQPALREPCRSAVGSYYILQIADYDDHRHLAMQQNQRVDRALRIRYGSQVDLVAARAVTLTPSTARGDHVEAGVITIRSRNTFAGRSACLPGRPIRSCLQPGGHAFLC